MSLVGVPLRPPNKEVPPKDISPGGNLTIGLVLLTHSWIVPTKGRGRYCTGIRSRAANPENAWVPSCHFASLPFVVAINLAVESAANIAGQGFIPHAPSFVSKTISI